ncbi:MAG TPA: prepilin-type N-terminal cleavage/methylation domain-containing protein [Candidatus Omnitrophota bacterium]|jgi:prepilin-type N-terminal cleavage/methylation domain-containing protein|nr:prepilin-type N-terminal cleavage/methylation domain-containing protein [Candidatus Omnitrophota bacterium]HQB94746.1 prepilin-type N-terminal cleavage/methylation domain-containing protein [Candidatus Omnitrophota bacterium]
MGPLPDKRGFRGFTLIEVMVALFVTTIAIAGYVGSNIATQRQAAELHERTIAVQEAQRVIEQMRDKARTNNFPGDVVAAFPDGGTVAGMNALPDERVQVDYVNPAATPLDTTVTVTWQSYTSRRQTAALRAYIAKRKTP